MSWILRARTGTAMLVLGALVGCGDDTASAPDAPPGCEPPALDAAWLEPFVTAVVAELAAAPRATVTEREAARTLLASRLAAIGWIPARHDYPSGANVYATIPATTGTGRAILVGAHFDTVPGSPGANDNASGVAVALAVARFLVDAPCRSAPVIVALFDQEEDGLFGSRAFAEYLDPADVRAVHTIDQVAWDSDGDRAFELELPARALESAWRDAAATLGITVRATPTGGTDHEAFRARGYAAIGLTEEYAAGDTSPYRHTAGDLPATVDTAYLVLASQLAARVVLDEVTGTAAAR